LLSGNADGVAWRLLSSGIMTIRFPLMVGLVLCLGWFSAISVRGELALDEADETAVEVTSTNGWLGSGNGEERPSSDYRGSALRSMGAMLLIIGVLLGFHYWFRRRLNLRGPLAGGADVKIVSRMRLNPRQELVIVEWEGEQLMLGVGATFIHRLHRRGDDGLEADELLEGAGHAL
jgi:flagellar biogenesis protein FliO